MPELGDLDWDLVRRYSDLLQALDQVNGQINRENKTRSEQGAPLLQPIEL